MPATFAWKEDNGAPSGGRGTTNGTTVTTVNWKSVDDATTTAYSAAPITAGNNSYVKNQFGDFSGTFNQILNGKWAHTAGALGTGLTLVGRVSNTYVQQTSALSGTTDMTSVIAIGSGQSVTFAATPNASGSSTLSSAGTTNYLQTQLQTTTSAAAGDTATVTLTLQYDEN
jgi:hypothetical protein